MFLVSMLLLLYAIHNALQWVDHVPFARPLNAAHYLQCVDHVLLARALIVLSCSYLVDRVPLAYLLHYVYYSQCLHYSK